ncbi:MAG: GxxExxY protein, partial [Candidatus Thiodiazotropha sp. 6PLUC4]
MSRLIFEEKTFAIRGAVFEVYREMGSGFLEQVYQECLDHELTSRGRNPSRDILRIQR